MSSSLLTFTFFNSVLSKIFIYYNMRSEVEGYPTSSITLGTTKSLGNVPGCMAPYPHHDSKILRIVKE